MSKQDNSLQTGQAVQSGRQIYIGQTTPPFRGVSVLSREERKEERWKTLTVWLALAAFVVAFWGSVIALAVWVVE